MEHKLLDKLLECFDPNREKAKAKLELIYCNLIVFYKKQINLPAPSEECAIDAIIRADESIKDCAAIANLSDYIFKIAWNVLHEDWRENKKRPLSLDAILSHGEPVIEPDIDGDDPKWEKWKERHFKYMEQCFESRSPEERALLQQYIEAKERDAVEKLAPRLNLKIATLRTRVHRLREELNNCVNEREKRFQTG